MKDPPCLLLELRHTSDQLMSQTDLIMKRMHLISTIHLRSKGEETQILVDEEEGRTGKSQKDGQGMMDPSRKKSYEEDGVILTTKRTSIRRS